MAKKYSLKELAAMLEPEQLGLSGVLLYCPLYPDTPLVRALLDNSAWREIKDTDGVLQAYPTLENYNSLLEYGLEFYPTKKVTDWHVEYTAAISYDFVQDDTSPLFDYQRQAAHFIYGRDRAMLSLSPGLGKTLTSAYAAGLRGFKYILVVCPASLLYYWKGELEKWWAYLPLKPTAEVWHKKLGILRDPNKVGEGEQIWIITNPETVAKHLEDFIDKNFFSCLIVDESIMYKHRDSQRSEAMKDLANHIDTVWLLTGAPATRYLDDMWHQFHILKPKGYSSYWRFARKYCIIEDNEWGSKVVANRSNAEKEIKKNFADIYFSRTQDDVANIPDWIMEDIDIPMHPAQDKVYDTLRKHFYIDLESVDPDEKITVGNHLSLMIRSVQVASNPLLVGGIDSAGKWDALPELMEIYPGPFIVWCNFIVTGEILRDRFSRGDYRVNGKSPLVALANGSTKMEDRNSMVNAFQNGELDVLILNSQVGKFGFTLTKARTAFFLERMYDDSYFQCLHRNRRIGTTNSPNIVNMRSVTATGKHTVDHLIHSTLDYRVGMIRKVTAGELKKVFANG